LPFVVEALDGFGLAFGSGEGGEEHGGEDPDDGDDHEEFDQGESFGSKFHLGRVFHERRDGVRGWNLRPANKSFG
jgi:hypothetical protein